MRSKIPSLPQCEAKGVSAICGLYGAASNYLAQGELQATYNLGVLSTMRGVDSSGLFFVTRNKGKLEPFMCKDTVIAPVLFAKYVKGGKLVPKAENSVVMVMGHTRAATLGAIVQETAHPFVFNKIVGAHNGTCHFMVPSNLTAEEKLTKMASDSWQIYNHMNQHGLDSTLDKIKNGAYALTWYDRTNNTINFIRNDKRPLTFGSTGGTLYWASEREFLENIKSRSRFAITMKDTEPYIHYSMELGHAGVKLNEVSKAEIAKPKPTVSVFHGGMYGHRDYGYGPEWEETLEASAKPASVPLLPGPRSPARYGTPYERIRTNPEVNTDKVLNYFQVIDSNGVVVAEPSQEEVEYLCKDGCSDCGTKYHYTQSPRIAFFAGEPHDFESYYHVCSDCIENNPKGFFQAWEELALEMSPVYVKEN